MCFLNVRRLKRWNGKSEHKFTESICLSPEDFELCAAGSSVYHCTLRKEDKSWTSLKHHWFIQGDNHLGRIRVRIQSWHCLVFLVQPSQQGSNSCLKDSFFYSNKVIFSSGWLYHLGTCIVYLYKCRCGIFNSFFFLCFLLHQTLTCLKSQCGFYQMEFVCKTWLGKWIWRGPFFFLSIKVRSL